jgi:hypothetical protein
MMRSKSKRVMESIFFSFVNNGKGDFNLDWGHFSNFLSYSLFHPQLEDLKNATK